MMQYVFTQLINYSCYPELVASKQKHISQLTTYNFNRLFAQLKQLAND